MKRGLNLGLILSAISFPMVAFAASEEVSSPDGKTVVTVTDTDGRPEYAVSYDGRRFVMPSPLGLRTNVGDFTGSLSLVGNTPGQTVADSYSLPNIKKSRVEYRANRREFTFGRDGKPAFDVIFEVSDNNVAFRYRLHPQSEERCCVVESEATGFVMPEGTTTFLCPQSKPMGGFARTSPSYETSYTLDDSTGKNGWGEGYSFPCLFRNGDAGWVLVSETGIAGDYCASHLSGHEGGLYTVAYPQPGEMNGFGSTSASVSVPGMTPWRTVTVGASLAPIVETTVAFDVVRPLYEPSRKYEYGRGTWSWIIGGDHSMNFDEQKRYVDFAADMGYESVLVDAWWDTRVGYERTAELARYAAGRGVGLYLWYNSNGYWNDAPQGPRGRMDNTIVRRREMKWMRDTGIRGIKVDFIGSDKQQTMQLYEDILADANDYGLLVIFHGCTLPRGWERMYPNFVASEAVLASENPNFTQESCDAEAFNACLHPFIRNAVGSMDFGGSALNKYYNVKNAPGGSRRVTSDVYALATAVLFQSSVQHFALAPNNLTDAPAWAVDFMKHVPSTWDDVRFIDGYPGRYVILARRHGDKWYVAGVNAQKETLKTEIALPMWTAGTELQVYADDAGLQGSVKSAKLGRKQTLKVTIPCNGGVLIVG